MATLETKYSKKQKKNIFYVVYSYKETDKSGKSKHKHRWVKVGPSKTRAEKALKEFAREHKNNPTSFNKKSALDLVEFIEAEYLPWSKSAKTKQEHENTSRSMKRFLEFTSRGLTLDQVDERHIERYKAWRKNHCFQTSYHQQSVSNRTINLDVRFIRQCFAKAVKWEILDKNPVADVDLLPEPKGRIRFFSLDEIDRLFEASNPYIERFLIFGINTGMRMSEMLNIRLKDIDFDTNLIHILNRNSFSTKSGKDRSAPISPQLKQVLPKYMDTFIHYQSMTKSKRTSSQKDYLFCGENGAKILCFRKSFRSLLKRANVKDASIHTMRHTYASHLVMAGVSMRIVKDLLGHSDIGTTMIYAHLSPEHIQKAVLALPFKIK